MLRTQIYITENEKTELKKLAQRTHKSQSELIRLAIDYFCKNQLQNNRLAILRSAKGLWSQRHDLPDLKSLRKEGDRFDDQKE